ncbi:hypothetical protein AURDEDRAFT_114315 [Auricularia subglabra TFB-10046 SS5]|uniref:MYND-type domain-containing protein n=1 Tax=Auricularia subglabra (strain TFB-10046 / SS5) TaxID=717982 RepID=J0WXZ3_AURST|nr:hypothetical protein AURDEDRAFT_114315 [Auricularia subglabra TFB-10046 SS5]
MEPDFTRTTLFRLLEECLQDEHRLDRRLCPICFLAVPNLLKGDAPDIPELKTQYHDLWDACMRNLTVPRTESDTRQLHDGLRRNIDGCSLGGPAVHYALLSEWGMVHLNDPIELFEVLLCLCLCNCLYGVDSSSRQTRTVIDRARTPRKHFASKKGSWPIRIDQLFPYGPDRTVKALATISYWLPDDSPLRILNAVLHLARPRIWCHLLEPGNILALSYALVSMTLYGTRWGIVAIQTLSQGALRERERPPIRQAAWLGNGQGLFAATEFLQTVTTGPHAHPDDVLQFMAPHMALFRRVYRVALQQAYTSEESWRPMVILLSAASDECARAREIVSEERMRRYVADAPRSWAVTGTVRHALHALAMRCAGPGCARTTLDTDGTAPGLSACAKCRVVRYCSKGCQRADWRNSHKRMCPIFSTMQAVADVHVPLQEYTQRIRESCVPDDYLVVAGNWALSCGEFFTDFIRCIIAVRNRERYPFSLFC